MKRESTLFSSAAHQHHQGASAGSNRKPGSPGTLKPINHASHLWFIINTAAKNLNVKSKCLLFDLQGLGYSLKTFGIES